MTPKRLLSVDVDLTVCPSDFGWYDWLWKNTKGPEQLCKPSPKKGFYNPRVGLPYNLGTLFETVDDPHQYWRELDYSQFKPIEGSVEKLKTLSQYFGIVFISAHKGTHGKSKYYWLEEHFPFASGVMLTKEKFLMNSSVVAHIDDRKSMLKGFDPHKRILYSTPYTQDVECGVAMTIKDWNSFSVRDFCEEYL